MIIDLKFIRCFPEYNQVFEGDLEKYKEHFLPICSINLQCIYPEEDQWVHFVSVKEIYEGCVGQETSVYHSDFCKEDMYGFDVVGDKYKFSGDWNYFAYNEQMALKNRMSNHQMMVDYSVDKDKLDSVEALDLWLEKYETSTSVDYRNKLRSKHSFLRNKNSDQGLIEHLLDQLVQEASEADLDNVVGAYELNEKVYELAKTYYKKHGAIYPMTIGNYSSKINTLEELEQNVVKNKEYIEYPEIGGILDDIQFRSKEDQESLKECDITFEEAMKFDCSTNLCQLPYDQEGNIFTYIGRLTGYLFQQYGADGLYLFYNKELKKAVVCLEYT